MGGVKFNISNFVLDTYIKIFFDDYQRQQESINGAIIMNCNPFTKGHRYLIEWASRKVELLFIFVVSEDKSLFSFEERMEMVKNGVCDLSNVRVIPSGEFILSDCTFPQYFGKIEDDKMLINAEYDVRFWGKYIAQCLQIKYRFVGEENDDAVTYAYNSAMKTFLPEYGINIIEIPRMKYDGENVSASKVRKFLAEGKLKEAFSLLPQSTQKIIAEQYEVRDS